ncbi:MAG TPA: DUF1800 domain-containing protein [Terriglobales bacterium]|nr:DUF1800 domain-containing protein [Terriglobales bacterium]
MGAVAVLAAAAAFIAATNSPRAAAARPYQEPAAQERIVQALDRLTWGIAPGDVAAVEKIGLDRWIELQLHPGEIPENPALAAALAPYDTLRMSSQQIIAHYPPPELIRQMALGRAALPSDPAARAMAEREIARLRQRQEAKAGAGESGEPASGLATRASASLADWLTPEEIAALRNGPPEDRVAAFLALPQAKQDAVIAALPRAAIQPLAVWGPPALERRIAMQDAPQTIVPLDLQSAKLLRAAETNRQLQDVLTDFWFNHFNVYLYKGADRFLITAYERDAIRPHVLGKFYDLLVATAESPAMLFYLDNWQSVDPNAAARLEALREARREMRGEPFGMLGPFGPFPPARPPKPKAPPRRGLNENYGREVMELHTIGLHYTQADVIAAARCFTGWTIGRPGHGGPFRDPVFYYNDALHDKGEKVVLGHRIKAGGGMNDGLELLRWLARDPNTARHISYELAQRFVADDPPAALVDRMSAAYLASDGDLRQVMETMIHSPEFWDPRYYRDQVKSPFEMVVSALRATGAQITNPTRLVQIVAQMGEPLYGKEPPTGYGNDGRQWVSASGLLARMNFAQQLAGNRLPGVRVDLSPFAPGQATASEVTHALYEGLLLNQVSENTERAIARELAKLAPGAAAADAANPRPLSPAQVAVVAGLVLGSPEFQER